MTSIDPAADFAARGTTHGTTVAAPPVSWPLAGVGADRILLAAVLGTAYLLAAVWSLWQFQAPINHDSAALLHFADRWLGGERLYVDLIDINPPLVFVLNLIPAGLARMTGLGSATLLTGTVIAAAAAVTFAAWRLFAREAAARANLAGPPSLAPLLLPAAILAVLVTPSELAQREHLATLFAIPYLVLAGLRLDGVRVPLGSRIAIAVLAAIGFALKPHFLLIPAAIEGYALWQRGRAGLRDPVPWTMAAFWIAYAAATWIAFPAYVHVVMPMAITLYDRLGDTSLGVALSDGLLPIEVAIVALGAVAFLAARSRHARTLTLFAAMAAVTTVIQGKGWHHQWLHASLGLMLLMAAVTVAAVDRWSVAVATDRRRFQATASTIALCFVYFVQATDAPPWYRAARFHSGQLGDQIALIESEPDRAAFLSLSPGIFPFFPMINYTGTRMAMPYMSLWILQGLYKDCPARGPQVFTAPEDMGRAERAVFDGVAAGFAQGQPKFLVIDRIPGMPTCDDQVFDYLEYFQRHPAFAEAFRGYDLYRSFDRYIVYRRR